MEDGEEKKKENKKKKKVSYNILFVPDEDSETVKHFSISLDVLVIFFAAVAFLTIAALAYCFILTGELDESDNIVLTLRSENDRLAQQNTELLTERDELEEKVKILSDTINVKVQREAEIAQSYIPTGFPLRGTASYNEEEAEFEGNPIVVFHASQGTSVIATANGTVSSIAGSAGVGYIVMVDHGNGYYSVYRNGSTPKVREGDAVTTATELFDIEAGSEALGYQIIENERYIDPLSIMESYG